MTNDDENNEIDLSEDIENDEEQVIKPNKQGIRHSVPAIDENDAVDLRSRPKKQYAKSNNPFYSQDNGIVVPEGDNSKYLMVNMTMLNWDIVDLSDTEQVKKRISDYFALYEQNDMKPTVAGLGMAFGINRKDLYCVVHELPIGTTTPANISKQGLEFLKKAYGLLENLWESYMVSGKINPVSGIFLAKNNYGYRDQTEYLLTPNQNVEDFDAGAIKDRYISPKRESEEKGE